jgi:hypothetical protein
LKYLHSPQKIIQESPKRLLSIFHHKSKVRMTKRTRDLRLN